MADAMITDAAPPSSSPIDPIPATAESLDRAAELQTSDPSGAAAVYRGIIADDATSAEAVRVKESAACALGEILSKQGKAEELRGLLTDLRPFFAVIPKAKTAKLVRTVIDLVAKVPGSTDVQLALCKEMVEWTRKEKRTFLRQRVEARLAALYMETKDYQTALALTNSLVREVRRLDDKLLLVDIDLLECRLHHQLRNIPKAKAALTAARTAANSIYVPPVQQGQIDMQSGVLHAEEKDYKTAYSYFFEAFECFNGLDDARSIPCLKYMMLCKIMLNQADDVASIIASKGALKYSGDEVDAMRAVATAHSERSLKAFEHALRTYKQQLSEDPIISRHLAALYDSLLEQNLLRLIEPFSCVEIAHIATLIGLPLDQVESKLSQMILDRKFEGTLDQGAGNLIVFHPQAPDALYPAAIDTIVHMGKVVESLFVRSKRIMA
eukprot:TRINITY_DN77987_c0_g1_i1.p1 TRINITY_DN77987_c0_g1~~TRINITY_DN77987_c0_g1_i1.p1  ORF type:complete len:439 (+),score=45.46 TRINITY_DN77987_c0_g1_i1:236-1552(+)